MAEKKPLPNIVIFIADEMRGDTVSLGHRHNPAINTPNIDALAEDGVAFTNCFTVNPVCGPSRISTFTGQYVHSSNHRSLYQLLQPHEDNLFKFLKRKGYEVIWVGRNDLFDKKAGRESVTKRLSSGLPKGNVKEILKKWKTNPFNKEDKFGKSFYFGERTEEQAQDFDVNTIQSALEYLDSKPNKPFCLYIAVSYPHPPYTVEEPYFSMYDRDKVPSPIPPKLNDKPEFMRIIHERYGLDKLTDEDFREIVATYYGMITRVDDHFGQVISKLKEINEYDNSAIFFLSDHGDFAGNYGLTEKWPNAFQDCLLNIPLVMKLPGIEPKKQFLDDLVQSIDLFPTIMEIVQIKSPYTHFGKSLLPLLKGELRTHRSALFAEGGYDPREPQCYETVIKNPDIPLMGVYYDKTIIPVEKPETVARSAMIRTKLWKLIIRTTGEEELYDLAYDPIESTNLAEIGAYTTTKINLKEKLLDWYLRTSDNAHWRRMRPL